MLPLFRVACGLGQQIFVELREVGEEVSAGLVADSVEELPHEKGRMVGAFSLDLAHHQPSPSYLGWNNNILTTSIAADVLLAVRRECSQLSCVMLINTYNRSIKQTHFRKSTK